MFAKLAGFVHRFRWPIVGVVVIFLGVSGLLGGPVAGLMSTGDDFSDPQSEHVSASERLEKASGSEPAAGLIALVRARRGKVGSPRLDRQARRAGERAQRLGREARRAEREARRAGSELERLAAPAERPSPGVARQLPRAQQRARAAARGAERRAAEASDAGRRAKQALRRAKAARSASVKAQVRRVARIFREDPAVDRVLTYHRTPSSIFVSRDRRATYVPAFFEPLSDDAEEEAVARLTERMAREEPTVALGGLGAALPAVGEQVREDLAASESIAFPLLFVLSLLVFRGLVAALLPLFVGTVTVLGTFLGLRVVNELELLSIFALNLVIGLGLGLAIDYSLFIVSRYREELALHGPGLEALRRTLRTAGRTVLFSALTVAAALASLLVFPQRFLYSMGIGGAICALLAAAVSLTALPAVLALLRSRVNFRLLPALLGKLGVRGFAERREEAAARVARAEPTGFWYRLSRAVMRHPGLVASLSATALIALGLPFLGIKFTGADASVLPPTSPVRQVSDAMERDFSSNRSSPISLAVDAPPGARSKLGDFREELQALPAVDDVSSPERLDRRTWEIEIFPEHQALDERTLELVRRVRAAPAPFPVAAAGESARFVDQQSALAERLPTGLLVLMATTALILFLMTGSVVLPLKSILMNVLGLSAALGLLVLIFQDGRLESLLDYRSQGAIESTQPILLFVIAFGLSTDYGVFLLTRIKEVYDAGAPNEEAVAVGLERTGRIVTAAALLLSIALGAFATSEVVFIKEVGLGTVLAVLIDATIIRALLVPSLMALLGGANWWAPRPLRWLHERAGLHEKPA